MPAGRFSLIAIAGKLRALRERRYFASRAGRAQPSDFERLLGKAGLDAPSADDDVPDRWLDTSSRTQNGKH